MRKLILVGFVSLFSLSAYAGTDTNWSNRWVKIAQDGQYSVTYYDNYDHVQKQPSNKMSNEHVSIRILVDHPLADGATHDTTNDNNDGFPSVGSSGTSEITGYEFNCKKEQFRTTYVTDFAENMGSSAPFNGHNDGFSWTSVHRQDVARDPTTQAIYKLACR
jgi:hypothetical protein